ncbi:hypothetical protein IHE45_09G026900 [Dioscorea alata]|uniref:Uncharacterized protein n=1 Tax=Dioscorea alata TaxID=55571 RepID=A0ACB7VDW9_DIOAL|nr:hypothetical protein IHE45_09G026900 [Dioscorea alata]
MLLLLLLLLPFPYHLLLLLLVPPTSTTPAPVAVTTVAPIPSIFASTEGGDAYTSRRVRIYIQSDRKTIIGHQRKRKLLKQFGKKSLDANIATIYVGGTSIMKRLVRSLLGLSMKFGINGLNTGIKMNSSISLGRL